MSKMFIVDSYDQAVNMVKHYFNNSKVDVFIDNREHEDNVYLSIKHKMSDIKNIHKLEFAIIDLLENTEPYKSVHRQMHQQAVQHKKEVDELNKQLLFLSQFKVHYDLEFSLRHGKPLTITKE